MISLNVLGLIGADAAFWVGLPFIIEWELQGIRCIRT